MKRKAILVTIIVWFVLTVFSAYLYARIKVKTPLSEPVFESMWGWHLLMFGIYLLPIFVIALILILWIEMKLLQKKRDI